MLYFLFFMAALVGCGVDDAKKEASGIENNPTEAGETKPEEQPKTLMSFSVDDVDQLPACEESNSGALAYLQTKFVFHHCRFDKTRSAGSWVVVSIVGMDGSDGKDGVDGKDGKDGDNGEDGLNGTNGVDGIGGMSRLSKKLTCTGELTGAGVSMTFVKSTFTSGDVFITTSIISPDVELSESNFFSKSQDMANNTAITINYDVFSTKNGGRWTIHDFSTGIHVTYTDTEVSGGFDDWYFTTATTDGCNEAVFN